MPSREEAKPGALTELVTPLKPLEERVYIGAIGGGLYEYRLALRPDGTPRRGADDLTAEVESA